MKLFKMVVIGCLLTIFSFSTAKGMNGMHVERDSIMPKVFLIGEYENDYNNLLLDYETLLFAACDFDMNVAYDKWMSMLREMEAYATDINFDLKGTKLWLNVFWEKDGTIKHVAYYLKPISRNVDTAELSAFFSSFMNNYTFPLVIDKSYSHYGSASFPLFPVRIEDESKKKTISDGTTRN